MAVDSDTHERKQLERALLAAARSGDDSAFGALTQPLQRVLHVHCYRMLGSLDDADDALQESLLRAWRQIDHFEPRAPFSAWLYRIATRVCLTMLARRGRHEVTATALEGTRGAGRKDAEPLQLDPYPDRLLEELAPNAPGPEATVVQREGIQLAFVAAVQYLPPRQRATLLLCDVVGYNPAEVAPMLATSVAGVNSALQRARATLERERSAGRVTHPHAAIDVATEQVLARRLAEAWHAADVPSIVALLSEDALITMPPRPDRYAGRDAIAAFFAARLELLGRFQMVPTRANHQPALAAYYRGDDGVYRGTGVFVLAMTGDRISSLVRLGEPAILAHFGMPMTLDVSG